MTVFANEEDECSADKVGKVSMGEHGEDDAPPGSDGSGDLTLDAAEAEDEEEEDEEETEAEKAAEKAEEEAKKQQWKQWKQRPRPMKAADEAAPAKAAEEGKKAAEQAVDPAELEDLKAPDPVCCRIAKE